MFLQRETSLRKKNTLSPHSHFCHFGSQVLPVNHGPRRSQVLPAFSAFLQDESPSGAPKLSSWLTDMRHATWGNANRFPFNASCLISFRNVPYMNLNIGYNIIWHSKHTVDHIRSRMANKQPAQATADPEKQEVQGHCGRGC